MHLTTLLLATFASLALCAPLTSRTTTPFCKGKAQGIYAPTAGGIITQDITSGECNVFEFLYCSAQYDKTASVMTTVGLATPGDQYVDGEILALGVGPDNKDAAAGYYSYRYNVTVCPIEGEYMTGEYILGVYEVVTGYYNANDYVITSENVTLATSGSSCDGNDPAC